MTGRWPYVLAVLLSVPFGGHALATDTFSTDGLVNIEDVRGDGHAYREIVSDGQVCLKRFGTSSYLQFADGSGDACTNITSYTYYSLNDVELPANPTTVQYVIITNGEQLDVRDSNNDYHKFADPNTELIHADYDFTHNIIMPYDTNKALWLYHDWRVFTSFVANEFDKTMDLDLNVMYEEGEFDRTGYIDKNQELTFQGDGLMDNGNAVLDQWTVFHEFSHHLMNEAYNDYFASHRTYPASCVDENSQTFAHFIYRASNGECAFSEGFADMMPHLILEETVIEIESYDYTFDIESPTYWDGDDMEDIAEGVTVEGRVAAALFDLLDFGNARDEDVTEDGDDFWEVFEIFRVNTATDIEDFYENWKDTHGYDSDLDDVYELNTLSAVLTSQEVTEIGDPVSSSTRIVLNWNATVTGAPTTFYEVLRATSPFVSIANVTSTTYVDEDVLPSTTYRYKIVPHSDHGPGLPSRIINASTAADSAFLVISAPPDVTAEATGVLSTVDIGTATATDSQDPSPAITNDAPDAFPLGTTTVTWTATNNAGNSAAAIQTVTVHDTTAPAITAPAAHTAEATGTMTELDADDYGTATATDLVDADPEITDDAPDSFPIGITTITWTATDGSGNSATAAQTVTVRQTAQPDTTAPEVTAPADVTAEATGVLTTVSIGQATATDDRDPSPEITHNAPDTFPLGDTEVTWTATDDAGNSATAAQTVTVRDTTPPAITAPPDIEVVAPPGGNATVYFAAPGATDLADPDVAASCTPASGSVFGAGSTEVACTATDDSGNVSSASFEVRVEAAVQDVLSFDFESGRLDGWTKSGGPRWHADGPAERTHPPGSPVHNRVAEADGCTLECTITLSSPVDLTPYRSGELTFYRFVDDDLDASEYLRVDLYDGSVWRQLDIWTQADSDDDDRWHPERYALDAYADSDAFKIRFSARMSSAQEQVAVDDIVLTAVRAADTAPPAIAPPPDAAFEATAPLTPLDAGDYGAATATDGSGAPPAVASDAPASFPLGDTVITWTATDASGNTATDTQTVTVRDTTPPAFTSVPGDLAVLTHHGRDAEAAFAVPEAEDIADPDAAVSCAPESGSGFPVGSTTVTCTATDSSGNESQASFEVRVGSSEATATVSRTVTGEGARWTVSGPAAVFAGETYEYTVTRESGPRPLNEALAIYSGTSTVDDFGQYSDGADCAVSFCAGFPGQAGSPYELDNHGGSAYDIRYRTIGAAGPGHAIALQVGDSAQAGAGVTVGLMDRHGSPRGGVQVTVADPATASTLGRQLVSHLAFEGDTRDSAGGSHGTVNGTESYVDGAAGRAFYFDGSTYVTLAGSEGLAFGTADPFTLSLWFKKDGPDAMRSHLMAKQDTRADPGLFMWIWPGFPSRIQTGINDGEAFAGVNTLRDVNVTDGTWRHVAVTYDGSGLRDGFAAYVDGQDSSDRRMALRLDGAGTNGAPVTLGALGAGHDRLHEAAIDELRVYSRELTAREVFELYVRGTG